ncbi:MAG: hypothetical protein Q9228_008064 [Teloschistes exilis]
MLWNWYTVDACFLSTSWHVTTNGMFAGTVIGIFCLTCAIELVRRIARDYDRRLIRVAKTELDRLIQAIASGEIVAVSEKSKNMACNPPIE